MQFPLAVIQEVLGIAPHAATSAQVTGWSIDSRTVKRGDLFFAIPGERFDGHRFLLEAFAAGAAAAVVSDSVPDAGGTLLRVPDAVGALQTAAAWAREQWGRPLVAVTGSAGKTSTKEILAALLGVRFSVGKTMGNLNNHLGLPLTLLRLPEGSQMAVVEVGMNHAGEIRALAQLARPQVGVVTNVGYAHMEAFESIDGIAAAKRELVEELAPDGVAVLNADDERVRGFRSVHPGRAVTFGLDAGADIRGEIIAANSGGTSFRVADVNFETKLSGRHAVSNILAGVAVASLFDIQPAELIAAVAELQPGKMRGERHVWRGITVLNDAYNSNPEAARSMIDVLLAEPAGRRIAVLGEMLELGDWAEALHREVGRYAAERGVDVLIGVRGASRFMAEEATSGKGKHESSCDRAAFFFENPEAAGDFLRDFVRPGDAILFKGSRGTQVENALARMEE